MPQRTIVVCTRQMPIRHLPITRILFGTAAVRAHARNGVWRREKRFHSQPFHAKPGPMHAKPVRLAGGKVNDACNGMRAARNHKHGIRLQAP